MTQTIRNDFDRYTDLASNSLYGCGSPTHRGQLRLVPNPDGKIRDTVDRLERSQQFEQLVATTQQSFSPTDHSTKWWWTESIQNFFRRSGFYLLAADDQAPPVDEFFAKYVTAFSTKERHVTHIAPIEHVEFARENLDFGLFTIRRFSRNQLAALLETSVNRVFYPWAISDVRPLDDYWFVSLEKTLPRTQPGVIVFGVNLSEIDKVTPTYTAFPELEKALLPLVSYPWQYDLWRNEPPERQDDWYGFRVSFMITVDDDLLRPPMPRPDIARFEREPIFDPATGEERDDDKPVIWTKLDARETNEREQFVRTVADQLMQLGATDGTNWGFFERAQGFLLKGFFADGFEQLLWHITTIEALLGEDKKDLTELLANRVSSILGETNEEKDEIRKSFRSLYDFRSSFIHGDEGKKPVLCRHLLDARNIARQLFTWFLAYLIHIQNAPRQQRDLPSRNTLLATIDNPEYLRCRDRKIFENLPKGFPSAPAWLSP
jgi:hypothetical protein